MRIQIKEQDDIQLLNIEGTVDVRTAPLLRGEFEKLLKAGARKVILNLSGVELLSSSGASNLVRLAGELDEAGGTLVLSSPSQRCKYVLDLLELPDFFHLFESDEAALGFFKGS